MSILQAEYINCNKRCFICKSISPAERTLNNAKRWCQFKKINNKNKPVASISQITVLMEKHVTICCWNCQTEQWRRNCQQNHIFLKKLWNHSKNE